MTDQPDLPPEFPRLSPERIAALRAKVKEHFRRRAEERAAQAPDPAPRYDDIFWRGTAWLDNLSYTDRWDDVAPDSADPEG
jgi:hypothetical protein